MDSGARVADLCAGRDWRAVFETRRGHRSAHRLCDDLVRLEVEVLAWTEALDGGVDEAGVDLAQPIPGEAEPIDDAGAEVLDENVDSRNQIGEDPLALIAF